MAHYAFLDENNFVTQVIVGRNEDEVVDGVSDWEAHYSDFTGKRCLRTSYNTGGGVNHNGGTAFRGNMAGIGYFYDEALDAFIGPSPYPSWLLNESTYIWEPPVADKLGQYLWDEKIKDWVRGPQPYPSWLWSEKSKEWEAPKPLPEDATRLMVWDETITDWKEVEDELD